MQLITRYQFQTIQNRYRAIIDFTTCSFYQNVR